MRRAWIALLGFAAACGSVGAEQAATTPVPTPRPTVAGVGELPDTVPAVRAIRDEPLVVITRPTSRDGVLIELIGDRVGGNRLLMIGDSIFAGTAQRYGGEMCAGLVPLGWDVAVEAEAGRFVEFGTKVVERLVPDPDEPASTAAVDAADEADWDAAAVFLGSNYRGDAEHYEAEMRTILDRLAPRPTLLYTVTVYRPEWAEVNDVIAELGEDYDNVTIIDWEDVAQTPGVLMADGLHPGDEGEQVLVELTAAALGRAQIGEGACLRETFRDDSAIRDAPGTPNTGSSSRGSSGSGSSTRSTSPPRTTTPRTTPPSTTSPSTTPGSTTPGSTSPPSTSPGSTTPGSTSPPSTSPPSTSPPTAPPTPPPTVTVPAPPPVTTQPPAAP